MEIPEDSEDIVYLDNAATVFPKPPEVLDRALDLYKRFGVNPGRSGYDLCLVGGDLIEECRKDLCTFFGGTDWQRLCFAYNASDALNLLIEGLVKPGDHVITTTVEHNSVIRPLNHLKRDIDLEVDFLRVGPDCRLDPKAVERHIRPNTRLVVMNHGSNVVGVIQPVAEVGKICREHDVRLVVDIAQTAGVVPIDVGAMNVDALAFTGHKSLLAPTGIGGLYVSEGVEVRHTRAGGTGVRSAYPYHLDEYPYRLEYGTANLLGIVALREALTYLNERTLAEIYRHEMEIFAHLQDGLLAIPGVTIHGTTSLEHRLPVVSVSVEGWDAADVGTLLDGDYNIATRTGLHCAPLIHEQLGTTPRGTVRLSVGPMNVMRDADAAIGALEEIAAIRTR